MMDADCTFCQHRWECHDICLRKRDDGESGEEPTEEGISGELSAADESGGDVDALGDTHPRRTVHGKDRRT